MTLRARHPRLRLPDALVIATAVDLDADHLLTTDRRWKALRRLGLRGRLTVVGQSWNREMVPATRTVRGIPTEIELDESHGTPTRCVLAVDNLTVIRKSLCTEHITRLDLAPMRAVCDALRVATAC